MGQVGQECLHNICFLSDQETPMVLFYRFMTEEDCVTWHRLGRLHHKHDFTQEECITWHYKGRLRCVSMWHQEGRLHCVSMWHCRGRLHDISMWLYKGRLCYVRMWHHKGRLHYVSDTAEEDCIMWHYTGSLVLWHLWGRLCYVVPQRKIVLCDATEKIYDSIMWHHWGNLCYVKLQRQGALCKTTGKLCYMTPQRKTCHTGKEDITLQRKNAFCDITWQDCVLV